jgi:hypothetical protein
MKIIRLNIAKAAATKAVDHLFDVEGAIASKPRLANEYQAVPELDRAIVDIIKPGLENGPWIAGGAAARWFSGEVLSFANDTTKSKMIDPNRVHDIDVFVRSEQDFNFVIRELTTKAEAKNVYQSSNALTFVCHLDDREWKVQVIKHFFPDVDTLLSRFDFTCCQIATDGNRFATRDTAVGDIKNRIIRLSGDVKPGLINRMVKYITYGYTPSNELLETISSTDSAITDILSQIQHEYDNIVA